MSAPAPAKKGSYPSRQHRFGPAPLASFEDLPTDDQDSSPEGGNPLGALSPARSDPHALKSPSIHSPDTLIPSEVSSPQIESDGDSLMTLTPCEQSKTQTPIAGNGSPAWPPPETHNEVTAVAQNVTSCGTLDVPIKVANKESPTQPSNTGCGHQKKLSSGSILLTPQQEEAVSPGADGSKRKGSWTDIFRGRSRSRSRSRSPQSSPHRSPVPAEARERDKGKKKEGGSGGFFSSLLKIGSRKSPMSKTPSPPRTPPRLSITVHDEDAVRQYVPPITPEEPQPNTSVGPRKAEELEQEAPSSGPSPSKRPQALEIETRAEIAPNLSQRCQEVFGDDPFEGARSFYLERPCQSIADIPSASASRRNSARKETGSASEQDHVSSESELGFDGSEQSSKKLTKQSSQDETEAETLLTQDSVESEEFLSVGSLPFPSTPHSPVRTPTRRQRLEVITIPIERPRSTTPINVAPLEAFIQSSAASPDPSNEKVEKIKLFLPGEQFSTRAPKSPRRSSLKSWLNFCEEGLQSPRCRKRSQSTGEDVETPVGSPGDSSVMCDSDTQFFPLDEKTPDSQGEEDAKWVATVSDEAERALFPSAGNPFERHAPCKCECRVCDCECKGCDCNCHLFLADLPEEEGPPPGATAAQEMCGCECHSRAKTTMADLNHVAAAVVVTTTLSPPPSASSSSSVTTPENSSSLSSSGTEHA